MEAKMVEYADLVLRDGFYLSILDMLLLGAARQKELLLLLHEDGEKATIQSMCQLLENIQDLEITDMARHPDPADQNCWLFVGTNASFHPSSIDQINHFLPAWHRKQLGEKNWSVAQRCSLKRLMAREAAHAAECERARRLNRSSSMDADEAECYSAELEQQADLLRAEDAAMTLFSRADAFAQNVPGDGNCALHTVFALESGLDCRQDFATRDQADQSEAEEETPEDWLMKFDFLEVLQPGDYGRKAPVRCKLCTSRKQPNGKVLEVHVMKIKSVKHFLGQHFSSSSHQKNLAIHEGRDALDQGLRVKCPGIDVDDKDCAGHLYTYREEFKLWVQMSNLKELAKHSYSFDASKGTWRARASSCEEQFESQSPEDVVCKECLKLGAAHSIARHVVKFSIKYYLANLLSCRIFQGAEAVEELLAKIKANPIYLRDPPYMENLLALKTNKLQQYVRASWLSTPLTGANQALISFVNSIVKPALNVCVHSVPENFVDVIGRLTACIASGESGESTIGTMKMASAILKGDLENHPLLHGITLQCLRRIDKEKRGITTMAGRRSTESQMEADLIADAGLFGFSGLAGRVLLDDLSKMSLPMPAVSILWPEVLSENFKFDRICQNALTSSLRLASECSGLPVQDVKQKYFTACSSAECFWDAPEDIQEEEETADNLEETVDCLAFLKQLQDEQKLLADEEVATSKEAAADAQPADSFEAGFSNIPDSDQLRQLMEKPASLEPFRSECSRSPKNPEKDNLLPTTLRAALAMRDQGDLFNHLFRLNLKLRSTKGVEPWSNDGDMKFFLTPESAEALVNAPKVNVWEVGATMTRGQAKAAAKDTNRSRKFASRGLREEKGKDTSAGNKLLKSKDKKNGAQKPAADLKNPVAADYKRTASGEAAIRIQLERLLEIHNDIYQESPIFDVNGKCRMAFEVVKNLTWDTLLKCAPQALSAMYHNLRGNVAYGEALEKLFRTAESQLLRDPPVRTALLHLVKEIGTFARHEKQDMLGAGPAPELAPPALEPGPLMTFYLYRVDNDQRYKLNGVNMANLLGDVWYLHNEVVFNCPRKFNISRLTRFKVSYRATRELRGQEKNFDHFVAFDKAKCTVPGCSQLHWDPLGYVLGCTKNDPGRVALPGEAAWYSLPGTCPSKFYFQKSASCIQNEPGGQCKGKEVGRSGWERVMVILTAVAESCGTSPRSPAIFETCDMMFQ
ncbi:Hypothetical protein SCF082_LOCUS8319 [Durusdinium trenchii]|uniref:Ubiquitinyl hydrolase 1 n=1 Tax=Durusdinium trenchii TaxID=1381693 RepID=A0ABP0IQ99_9DINO